MLVCAAFALVVLPFLALNTNHDPHGTGRAAAPLKYGGISMESFLKYFGAFIAALFFLAMVAGVYAGLAWIIKAVWTS